MERWQRIQNHRDQGLLIDQQDYDLINDINWVLNKSGNCGYFQRGNLIHPATGDRTTISLHQFIYERIIKSSPVPMYLPGTQVILTPDLFWKLQSEKLYVVDHINRIRKDCRRDNLRLLTQKQNRLNSKLPSTNQTGFKYVNLLANGRFRVQIRNSSLGQDKPYIVDGLRVLESAVQIRNQWFLNNNLGDYLNFLISCIDKTSESFQNV